MLRYGATAGISFIIDISALFVLTEFFHIYYLYSAAIAYVVALIIHYVLNVWWVFNKRKIRHWPAELALFSLIGIVGLGLNQVLMWFFTEIILIHYLISKVIARIFIFFWNFFMRKYMLF
ncbi:GtrA family protein [Patescibacteria group bacterium AH-259-L07]|nr:GtrA family protein [Patescibacteria group bacterium AH-259-L07]